MTENWTKEWERRVVNGVYPLRRFLGRSNHSVVFLTECSAQNVSQAAIKILPTIPALSEIQLEHWRTVASLSHPHLLRLLDAGRCELGGHHFLFVVMDLAEQNLAQILPGRPLIPEEVRDLIPATLDALAYLHGKNLVQGGLKPPNFLVVDDRLKLASDTIRPAGARTVNTAKASVYDPPEARKGRMSTAGDMWGLGITLVEALTQAPPAWSRDSSDHVSLPQSLAPEFVDPVTRCLNRDPEQRPAAAVLLAELQPLPPATPSDAAPPYAEAPSTAAAATPPDSAPPVINEPLGSATFTPNSNPMKFLVTAITVGIVALAVVWAAVRLFHTHAPVEQTAAVISQSPAALSPPAAVDNPKPGGAAAPPPVLHQEIPDVSRHARESIRGVIKIAVRVSVDRSGNVVSAALDDRGSSKHLARASMAAAKKWKFAQDQNRPSRVWLLDFEFTHAGATADATEVH